MSGEKPMATARPVAALISSLTTTRLLSAMLTKQAFIAALVRRRASSPGTFSVNVLTADFLVGFFLPAGDGGGGGGSGVGAGVGSTAGAGGGGVVSGV